MPILRALRRGWLFNIARQIPIEIQGKEGQRRSRDVGAGDLRAGALAWLSTTGGAGPRRFQPREAPSPLRRGAAGGGVVLWEVGPIWRRPVLESREDFSRWAGYGSRETASGGDEKELA
jgi:hypothetical protein